VAGYSELVDGVELPALLAGHPALELCNTRAGWNGGRAREYLSDFDHLALWAGHTGLLRAPQVAAVRARARHERRAAALVLARTLRFRADLYHRLEGAPAEQPRSWTAFDAELRRAARALHVEWEHGRASLSIDPGVGLAAPLLAAAWSAMQLLTSEDVRFVRACPGSGCGWLFLDRRGRRQWCTMQTCGNRAKARRFTQRQRSASLL
jgi:predicted RNA-binding Zn ribbon-like protein